MATPNGASYPQLVKDSLTEDERVRYYSHDIYMDKILITAERIY